MVLQDLKNILKEYGVVGAGGAGFPTYGKLSYDIKKVILNGAECEPLFRVDRNILKEKAYEVLKGLDIIVETLGAEEGIVAFKEYYKEADFSVTEEIVNFKKLRKKLLKDGYPVGDEVVLVYEVTGKIVPQGGIPLNVGVMVINVETALNVYNAIYNKKPVTHKYLTIGGLVNKPKTLCVPIGTNFKELINEVNGTLSDEYEVLIGGPMTGRIGLLSECVTKTTKGIFLIEKDNPIVCLRKYKLRNEIKKSMGVCSQCRMCTDLCPRHLLGHSIEPHKIMNSLVFGLDYNSKVFINSFACSGCNLCSSYACHQGLNPKEIIENLKVNLRKANIKPIFNEESKVDNLREYRRVPVKRVLSRLRLAKYDKDAPISNMKNNIFLLKIDLKQSIGNPATPVVKEGDKVNCNDTIAVVLEENLGVNLHAPIDGVIKEVSDKYILIRKE